MNLTLYTGRPEDCTGRLEKEVRTYDLLDKLGMEYWCTDHAFLKADTMEDCQVIDDCLGGDRLQESFPLQPAEDELLSAHDAGR